MWQTFIAQEKKKKYFQNIMRFIKNEIKKEKKIYPPLQNVFEAFSLTSFQDVKVVILGQDPYFSINQAHGLSFSTQSKITPSSLRNIFKELKNDLNLISYNNNLTSWALKGVLLLNSILTVESEKPLSHKNIGWEEFTKNIFKFLNKKNKIVYILWGKSAQEYEKYIDIDKNYILKSPHPSPFSAYKGFFGSKPFSKTNSYLIKNKILPIDWSLDK
ncbi:uracil-DNA glycosylase [Columbia Basin potato purple top phytoplasma]|uniref:Uracil-DNA glycosylase n=1 Tax=Columbia Basin potato purple top phytoplasma TaxID=307134 RepID=A0ABT5LBU5_9MOLU|nr:uracil-DNA glycosylase [Columbia Basin potato purple top phytoplasma]MDC9032117.1 uracil-DNA glycosylase [Columbia Basin potato purple top phytoplasma]